jgi:GTPase SAR1 family protein
MASETPVNNLRSMESEHKQLTVLRCKCVVVGDACTGKTALTQVFNSGGNTYPKNYVMVRSFIVPSNMCHVLYMNACVLSIFCGGDHTSPSSVF